MSTAIVVIGYGPVGARFVDELLPEVRSGLIELTVIGAERHVAYNRVLMAEYAVGDMEIDAITISDRAAAEEAGVRILTGVRATSIERMEQEVTLSTGERLRYDSLIFATGARSNVPTLDGVVRVGRDLESLNRRGDAVVGVDDVLPDGITVLRDVADAERIRATVNARGRMVILGAGVLGLELGLAASQAGAEVAVVHHASHPMPRNLNRGAGSVLQDSLRAAGVTVIEHSRAEAVGFRQGVDGSLRFDALITADGKQIDGDLLVLSCGVSPRVELAVLAGLRTAVGIVVTSALCSVTDPRIYAVGDCAHVVDDAAVASGSRLPGGPSGLIGPGWRQAVWLAARLVDEANGSVDVHAGLPVEADALVMLKADGVDVVAVGDLSPEPWEREHSPGCTPAGEPISPRRVAEWADPENGSYVKMVTRDGVLTAFASVGMPRTAAELTLLYERGAELPADRSVLLRFDGADFVPDTASDAFAPESTVCWCNGVSVQAISSAATVGEPTLECVSRSTRAGTGCGGCKGRITELLARLESSGDLSPVA